MIILKSVIGIILGISFMCDGFSAIIGYHRDEKFTAACAAILGALVITSIVRLSGNTDYIGMGVNAGIVLSAAIGVYIITMLSTQRSNRNHLRFELQNAKFENQLLRQQNKELIQSIYGRETVNVTPNKNGNKH